jgi:pimeloyl-ACP methyl ester carboxylesterase
VRRELGLQALSVDLPGHGSDTTDVAGWTMGHFVDALEKRRQDAGASCVILVAHSNGAYFVRQYWKRHSDRVAGLVVVEGTFVPPFRAADAMRASIRKLSENWSEYVANPVGLEHARPETVGAVRAMVARASLRSAVSTLEILVEDSVVQRWPMAVPVTFALAQSPHWTPEHRGILRQMAPRAHFVELGSISHYAPLDAPKLVADTVRKASVGKRCPKRGAAPPLR